VTVAGAKKHLESGDQWRESPAVIANHVFVLIIEGHIGA